MPKPIRTLILLRGVPYPAMDGVQLRNRQSIEALLRHGPVRLVSIESKPAPSPPARDAPPFRELYTRPPRNLVDLLIRVLAPAARRRRRLELKQRISEQIGREISREIAAFAPDLIVFGEPVGARYVPKLAELEARIVYDSQNVDAALYEQLIGIEKDGARLPPERLGEARDAEASLMQAADQVWVCSAADEALFVKTYGPQLRTRLIPNGIDVDRFAEIVQDRLNRVVAPEADRIPTLLFTGTFSYGPNVEAFRFAVREVLPVARKRIPGLRMVFCGKDPPREMRRLARRDPAVVVTGRVPDVRPWLQESDVVLVPVLHGGGTRVKILEAFAAGRPVVSTTKGAEGLEVSNGVHLLLADTAGEITRQIEHCLTDPELTTRQTAAARALVAREYSWAANAMRIDRALADLFGQPDARIAKTPFDETRE